ncbi:MAG TPA: hypothetical protein VE860_23255 [Chthoniobacterales bacterium]|jgi:hypothetical protein|nr:hypothetical protein [Chthoniobacterales bacterium]
MLALAVAILILAVVTAVLVFWSSSGKPGWLARGLCLLLLILCIVAAYFA